MGEQYSGLDKENRCQSKIILHLSDIHFGRNKHIKNSDFSHRELILDRLIQTIGSSGYKPSHIIFTGDIAWFGKKEEFDEAYNWFQKLIAVLGLSGRDITFCPGNHDVNWNYLNYDRNLTINTVSVIDEIYKYKNVFQLETPKENYNIFCGSMKVLPFHYPLESSFESSYSIGYKDIGDDKFGIRIYSFDTSLLSTFPKINEDNMFIGQPQVIDLIENGLFDTDRYKIAIFHHAERFLNKNEICEYNDRMATLPLLRDYVDLVLCGHTETGGKPVLYKQDEAAYTLTSGAAYYDDDHQNSFCFIKIDADKKISLFPYSCSNYEWKPYIYNRRYVVNNRKNLPQKLGEMEGNGEFRIMSPTQGDYVIPLNEFSIYDYKNDDKKGNNLDDPNRKIDIKCIASVNQPGTAKFNIESPRTCVNSVDAAIKYEELFYYLSKLGTTDKTPFYMKNGKGKIFFEGENVKKINEEGQDISYYKNLSIIEHFFDIRFKRPDKWGYNEIKAVDTLLNFINKDYAIIDSLIECSAEYSDKAEMEKLIEGESALNYYLLCEDTFVCCLHGALFEFDAGIISGPYFLDEKVLKKKIETFIEGDKRRVDFKLKKDGKTYLVKEDSKVNLKIEKPEKYINIKDMQLKWSYFKEKEHKKFNL